MKKKLGVGVIGLGRIFYNHLNSIKQIDKLQLSAVCDINESLCEEIGRKEKVSYYCNYNDLINDKNVDIVSVCAPNYLHFDIGIAIAKKNKHCVMEKPIAKTYKDGKKLVAAFEKSKGLLFPVLQVRYNPAVQVLKKYAQNGFLGKILTASLIVRWSRPQEYFDKSLWRGTLKKDGGSLLSQAIHYIDAMQYILGTVKTVFGKIDRVFHKIETEDIANAVIDFESGARANFEFTICAYPHNLECSLTVLGETGSIKIGGLAMNKCELWEVKNTPKPPFSEGLAPNIYANGMYIGSCPNHKAIYQNLVDVLLNKKPCFIKASDALESLKIIDGIKKSSKVRREIIINDD